jgi:hypothetical protein
MLDDLGNILDVVGGGETVKVEVSLPQQQLIELAIYLFVAFLVANILSGLIVRR